AAGRATGIRPDRIAQAELREYHELKAEQDRLAEEIEARRQSLIGRLAQDVHVEPGPFRAWVSMFPAQMLTTSKLVELLGEAEVEDLKSRVAPSPRTHLHVVPGP